MNRDSDWPSMPPPHPPAPARTYRVGGAVRDRLMREEGLVDAVSQDNDWVVVGIGPDEMARAGFTPVGADFPVFLHPVTHEEFALARTERKTAAGYHGFTFHASREVTLEDDLRRRDLTINAMAEDSGGRLIDPYGGLRDLKARLFRHVSDAFSEDPVRLLRVARFAARFPQFSVAPETRELLSRIVSSGEADALVAERVWAELSRGLMEKAPGRMVRVLLECGFSARVLTGARLSAKTADLLDEAARRGLSLEARVSVLFAEVPDRASLDRLWDAVRAPASAAQAAALIVRLRPLLARAADSPENTLGVILAADALRRPERLRTALEAARLLGWCPDPAPLLRGLEACLGVDAGSVASRTADPSRIPEAIRQARLEAIRENREREAAAAAE